MRCEHPTKESRDKIESRFDRYVDEDNLTYWARGNVARVKQKRVEDRLQCSWQAALTFLDPTSLDHCDDSTTRHCAQPFRHNSAELALEWLYDSTLTQLDYQRLIWRYRDVHTTSSVGWFHPFASAISDFCDH